MINEVVDHLGDVPCLPRHSLRRSSSSHGPAPPRTSWLLCRTGQRPLSIPGSGSRHQRGGCVPGVTAWPAHRPRCPHTLPVLPASVPNQWRLCAQDTFCQDLAWHSWVLTEEPKLCLREVNALVNKLMKLFHGHFFLHIFCKATVSYVWPEWWSVCSWSFLANATDRLYSYFHDAVGQNVFLKLNSFHLQMHIIWVEFEKYGKMLKKIQNDTDFTNIIYKTLFWCIPINSLFSLFHMYSYSRNKNSSPAYQ